MHYRNSLLTARSSNLRWQARLQKNEQDYATAQAQLKQANAAELQKLQANMEKQTALMSQASDEQVKALTADLNKQITLLKQKEAGLEKAQAESQTTREALAKQQAAAKALEQQNQQLAKQLQDKAQQADKIQALISVTNREISPESGVRMRIGGSEETAGRAPKRHKMHYRNSLLTAREGQLAPQARLQKNEQDYATAQAQLKQANAELQKLQANVEKQTALMSQASDEQVKALTADLNKQIALLKQKEAGLEKAQAESQTTREALAKQQAAAEVFSSRTSSWRSSCKTKRKQADKIQASLAEQTAKLAQKAALEARIGGSEETAGRAPSGAKCIIETVYDSEKQQLALQARLQKNEQDYATAQAQLKQANAELQKLQANMETNCLDEPSQR
ncbi:hypothetical protein [Providencia huaxiensis]|uniref:hypothetical protein n=1 Tax=Providencia huaxiensis TaxID=2027290 RepID=UPI0034DD973D